MQTGHSDLQSGSLGGGGGGQEGCLEEVCLQDQLTREARMGRKSVVVATLLVHSVKVATSRQTMSAMAGGGTFSSGVSLFPSHSDRPDFCEQRKTVYERLGFLGLQSLLLGLWEGPAPASTSLESSESVCLGRKIRPSQNQRPLYSDFEEPLGAGRRVG